MAHAGSLLVVPRGEWHRPGAGHAVSLLYVTRKTEHSMGGSAPTQIKQQ
jgi:hypothetical protein